VVGPQPAAGGSCRSDIAPRPPQAAFEDVSDATRPRRVLPEPGANAAVAVCGRYSFASAAPAPCSGAPLSVMAGLGVGGLRVSEPTVRSEQAGYIREGGALRHVVGRRREAHELSAATTRTQARVISLASLSLCPPKQARAYGASRRSLLVRSGRLMLDQRDARNQAKGAAAPTSAVLYVRLPTELHGRSTDGFVAAFARKAREQSPTSGRFR
jgi:hypothetical protein